MFKKIINFAKDTKCPIGHLVSGLSNFIKYSNVFTIVALIAFVAVASVMAANGDVKKVIGEEIIEKSGVDNSALLAADLENFDMKMEITNAMEDGENYYINYQYNTLAIKDNVWQEVLVEKQMTVSKASLDGRDLGLYVMEELGEIIDYQLAFLKEVQEKEEEEKGETFVTETTKYTKLIGLVFNTKTKELQGYEPVVKPPVAEETTTPSPSSAEEGSDDDAPHPNPLPWGEGDDDDFVEDSAYYQFLINNCLNSDGYWYNNTCNAEAESTETSQDDSTRNMEPTEENPADNSVCDVDNIDLCDDQDLCEGISLYWYGDVCNAEAESTTPAPSFGRRGYWDS